MVLQMCTMVEGRQENNWLLILQQLWNNGCNFERESMDNRVPVESQEICFFVNEDIFSGDNSWERVLNELIASWMQKPVRCFNTERATVWLHLRSINEKQSIHQPKIDQRWSNEAQKHLKSWKIKLSKFLNISPTKLGFNLKQKASSSPTPSHLSISVKYLINWPEREIALEKENSSSRRTSRSMSAAGVCRWMSPLIKFVLLLEK